MFRTVQHPGSRLKLAFRNLRQRAVAAVGRSRHMRELKPLVRSRLDATSHCPLISLICPLRQTSSHALQTTIRSLASQPYPHWELILVGTPGRMDGLQGCELRTDDTPPIRMAESPHTTPIAQQLNRGVETAQGSWCAFLEAGDRLTADALSWVWLRQGSEPQLRWIYTDESYSDRSHTSFNHKPDFSPELMLSQMFTGNLNLLKRDTILSAGSFRSEFGEACLYDLCLRLSEDLPQSEIAHIPYALFHRASDAATLTGTVRSRPEDRRALAAALARRKVRATVCPGSQGSPYPRIRFVPQRKPHVTVVIPTHNSADLLISCVESLRQQTEYGNYQVLVIDHQSDDPKLFDYFAGQRNRGDFDVFPYSGPFNHSEMHNQALATVDSEFVVLANNDVDQFSGGWLEELMGTAELASDIAGVGTKLIYPDETIQHGGIILGLRGYAAHSHSRQPQDSDGYFGRLVSLQQYSGATAALLLLRTAAFRSVSGFDAEAFPTSFNDVDLWLRLRAAGFRCIYNPSVRASHWEGKTRSPSPDEAEYRHRLAARWPETLHRDPFYNLSLSTRCEFVKDFGVDSQLALLAQLRCGRLTQCGETGLYATRQNS